MTRYSVYDHTRRAYDYYEAPGPGGTHAGSPPLARTLSKLGSSPERASWTLPLGARKVGTGERPLGRIASLGGDDVLADPVRWALYAALAFVGWKALR